MKLASPALVLAVDDMGASRQFLERHLGFSVAASGEGFVSLGHEDHDLRIIVGPLPEDTESASFADMQVGFLVDGIDEHWERLKDSVMISEPIRTIDLGPFIERFFRIADPNGVTYRLIELS